MQAPGELKSVGKRVARLNGSDIVTGRIQYADDIQLPGMLYGRILRSPDGHARIRKIDTSGAEKLPGVVDVVCGRDVPDLSIFESEEVCYQGQKVAAVAAVDPDIAEVALALIEVDYEVLPAVVDPVDAMDPDAPEAVLGAPTEDVRDSDGRRLRNVTAYNVLEEGDVERGFADADAIVEAEYQVPFFNQTYMEPNAATARVEADGRLTVWAAGQGTFTKREGLAEALNIPEGRVRVIMTETGGSFGGKNRLNIEAHTALLAMRTGRPVKVTINRGEDFRDSRPGPGCWVRLKTGARKDGTLTAVEGRIVWDGGILGSGGAANRLLGPYKIPNIRLEGMAVRTNKPGPGAYRAPGGPQTALARESNLDMLARKLEIDPVEIRLKNGLGKGDQPLIQHDWLKDNHPKVRRSRGMGPPRTETQPGYGNRRGGLAQRVRSDQRVRDDVGGRIRGRGDRPGGHHGTAYGDGAGCGRGTGRAGRKGDGTARGYGHGALRVVERGKQGGLFGWNGSARGGPRGKRSVVAYGRGKTGSRR